MHEATKAIKRRGTEINSILFKGKGIDIGAGPDCINKHGFDAYNWDITDGDAQTMTGVKDNTYDFVHSSHCLEHMREPSLALRQWIRICKPDGYIVVIVPDEELYEHNKWPSIFNSDHKWSFRMESTPTKHSLSVLGVLRNMFNAAITISVKRIEDKYDWNMSDMIDQTMPEDGPECSIEFILRKHK